MHRFTGPPLNREIDSSIADIDALTVRDDGETALVGDWQRLRHDRRVAEIDVVRAAQTVGWTSIEQEFAGDGDVSAGVLLLGNGFSTNIWSRFAYSTLLERSGLDGTARDLFGSRTNFETVLAELSTARKVLGVARPGEDGLLALLKDLASEVRHALLKTVGEVHPDAGQLVVDLKLVLDGLAKYLPRYTKVFVTNYDLISYWAAVRGGIVDLFPGPDPFDERKAEYWLKNNTEPKIFFLHGALHLWRSLVTNAEGKHTAGPDTPLLDVIRSSVNHQDRVPLFISEGSSGEKSARISASPYLSFCGRALAEADAPLTVLGQALADVDQHICEAIERHPNRKVAIGVWVGDVDSASQKKALVTRATEIRGRLANCCDVVFFDSAEHPLTNPKLRVKNHGGIW